VGGTLEAGKWTHVAVTYDAKDAKVLINGKVEITKPDPQKRDLAPSALTT